jgi:hypothetical protein
MLISQSMMGVQFSDENLPGDAVLARHLADAEPTILMPESLVEDDGVGPEIDSHPTLAGRLLVLTLGITRVAEQQSTVVSIWGSPDKLDWGEKPLAAFPQKHYCGTYSMLLNLSKCEGVRYLRVHWQLKRWSRLDRTPLCSFYVFAEASGARLQKRPAHASAAVS